MKIKNRVLSGIICSVLVVLCVIGITACGKCSHSWGEWTVKTEATCTAEGTQERACTKCGETETSAINALGHNWDAATCQSPKTCKICSLTEGEVSTHSYTVETVKDEALKSAASCKSGAVYYKSCVCGAISESDTFTYGNALEHKDGNGDHACDYACGTVLAECTDAENDGDHNCDVCGKANVGAHSYGDATCGAPATCTECGATNGAALEHKDENKDHVCDYACGKNDIGEHTDSASDNDHVCDYGCGATLENCTDKEDDGDHDCDVCAKAGVTSHAYAVVSSTDATCVSAAAKSYKCNCGDGYSESYGDALGHDVAGATATERQEKDCKWVLVYECQRNGCGEEVIGETVYHHNHVASITTPATCLADGVKTLLCACGDTKTEVIEKNSTGHIWEKGAKVNDGIRVDTCSVCKTTKNVTVFEGNVADNLKAEDLLDKELELNDTNISLDQGVIDAIGSGNDVTVSADKLVGKDKDALGLTDKQMEQVGNSPIYNFAINNGNGYVSEFGENNWVTVTLPYTLSDGEDVDSIAIWFISNKCENKECKLDKDCADPAHRLVSIKATYNNGFVTFKTNHFSYYTVTKLTPAERCALYDHNYVSQHIEGGCTQDSYDLYVCVRCHDKYIDEKTYVKADGHDYTENRTAATCTENGQVTYTCNDCGYTYKTRLNATGHVWVVTSEKAASCAADGYTKYECTACDAENVVVYAKLPHDYTRSVVKATCTLEGYTLYDCDNCDYSYKDSYVAALGHSYKISAWNWAADYSAASALFVCENDAAHTVSVDAAVLKTESKGACSNFVKTTYTANLSYGGSAYTDEKIVEVGNAEHSYASVLSKNETEHWYECVCGAKKDATAHTFENETVNKEPTCAKPGESISYCVCGAVKVTEIAATGNHDYVDGVCSLCGGSFESYYSNLATSWKNIDGFSVKIKNFSYEVKRNEGGLLDSFKLIGSIKQLDVAELSLFVEDGKLGGAAIGSVVIYNGPILNGNAVYKFKAVIDGEYVYMALSSGKDVATKTEYMKISIDALFGEMFGTSGISTSFYAMFEIAKEAAMPALEKLIESNSKEANAIFEKLFNIVFTLEKQSEGTYVATLDYDKLRTLNENLATKSFAQLIDTYFGEGSFDDVIDFVSEILNLELSEIPAYLDDHGIDSAEIIAKINKIALDLGASKDYDLAELLNSDEYKGVTLGMIMFECDDNSYVEDFNDGVEYMRENSFYAMICDSIGEGTAVKVKDKVNEVIEMLDGSVAISFATSSTGMLTSIKVDFDGFTYKEDDDELTVDFELEMIMNGKIDVTWSDIVDEIENGIVAPDKNSLPGDEYEVYNGASGVIEFRGEKYRYEGGTNVEIFRPMYDKLLYVAFGKDCGDWTEYLEKYATNVYWFTVATVRIDGVPTAFILYNDEVVKIVKNTAGFVAEFEDGTKKNVAFSFDSYNSKNLEKLYADMYFAVVGYENAYTYYGYAVDLTYYYNSVTGKYADESQHEYEYAYTSGNGVCSADGCTVVITCKKCDLHTEETQYRCVYESIEVIGENSSCGSTMVVGKCKLCGNVSGVQSENISCNLGEAVTENITDSTGAVIGTKETRTCSVCGLSFVSESWTEKSSACSIAMYRETSVYKGDECIFEYSMKYMGFVSHEWEYTYELKGEDCYDGYSVTQTCKKCGDTMTLNGSGHKYQFFNIDLSATGCYGEIRGQRCDICDEMYLNYEYVSCKRVQVGEVEEKLDSDGNVHYIATSVCSVCGRKFVDEEWTVADGKCTGTTYYVEEIWCGDELVFENHYSYWEENHKYEYSYKLYGDDCDDGYDLTAFCTVCGYSEKTSCVGHHTQKTETSLAELGFCGGYYREYRCIVCREIVESSFNTWCYAEYVETDANGYAVYECYKCGGRKLTKTEYSEKDEYCTFARTEITLLYMNGVEVLKGESRYYNTRHNYEYFFFMDGTSCIDGYIVATACKDCQIYKLSAEGGEHYTYEVFASDDESGKCAHYVSVNVCPCGAYSEFNCYYDSFKYDEATETYYCEECGLSVLYATEEYEDGCYITVEESITVILNGETIFTKDIESTYSSHDFSKTEVNEINGVTVLTASCTKCGKANETEIIDTDLENHGDSYYYDYVVIPDVTTKFTVLGLAKDDTYVILYKMVDGRLVEIDHNDDGGYNMQFMLTAMLDAGETYVFRIRYLSSSKSENFKFAAYKSDAEVICRHNDSIACTVLLGKSCEEGVLYCSTCVTCGGNSNSYMTKEHERVRVRYVDLAEVGGCYGELEYYSCACGENQNLYVYSCGNWSYNEYYEDGKLMTVETRNCEYCGLRYTKSYYSEKDSKNCTRKYYCTVLLNIGTTAICELEYTDVIEEHDLITTPSLKGGEGSSCEDGVVVAYKCKDCNYSGKYETTYHEQFEKERIDLSKNGSVCGGYVVFYSCLCGYSTYVDTEHILCDRNSRWCEIWIDGVIAGSQETVGGTVYLSYSSWIYTCAVTDPACAYKIRYAEYWLREPGTCLVYQYETWEFGYNEADGTCLYELTFKTGSKSIWHNYVDASTENSTKFECSDCGSYYSDTYYYDSEGNRIKYEHTVINNANDGYAKSYEYIVEYATDANGNRYESRRYTRSVYADGNEYWSETKCTEEEYVTYFGDSGYKVTEYTSNSYGEKYGNEYAYVWYKGYYYTIYTIETYYDGSWERYDYVYDFKDKEGCIRTITYTNSYGEIWSETENCCKYGYYKTIKDPTCSQDGEGAGYCEVCENFGNVYVIDPLDHNWVYITNGLYYCFRCGLENANGESGSIVMEDLTEKYGNGENYVVGYYSYNNIEFTYYVSLIMNGKTEIIVPGVKFIEIPELRAIAFSKAEVEAFAKANGYTDYDVRFAFVPVGADGSFDYAVTFADKAVDLTAIVGKVAFSDYITSNGEKCYVIKPTEDATWIFTAFSEADTYARLCDANGNEIASDDDSGQYGYSFRIEYKLKAGETYYLYVGMWTYYYSNEVPLLFYTA